MNLKQLLEGEISMDQNEVPVEVLALLRKMKAILDERRMTPETDAYYGEDDCEVIEASEEYEDMFPFEPQHRRRMPFPSSAEREAARLAPPPWQWFDSRTGEKVPVSTAAEISKLVAGGSAKFLGPGVDKPRPGA